MKRKFPHERERVNSAAPHTGPKVNVLFKTHKQVILLKVQINPITGQVFSKRFEITPQNHIRKFEEQMA